MSVFATVLSGSTVSSAVVLEPADRAWAIECPSMSGNSIRVQYASTSGGGLSAFATFWPAANLDATINSSTVRPAVTTLEFPYSPWARVTTGVAVTDTATFVFNPVNRSR